MCQCHYGVGKCEVVRYFPCLFFFLQFSNMQVNILIRVLSRLEVFFPMLNFTSLWTSYSLMSFRTSIFLTQITCKQVRSFGREYDHVGCPMHETGTCGMEGPFFPITL